MKLNEDRSVCVLNDFYLDDLIPSAGPKVDHLGVFVLGSAPNTL